MKASDYDRLFDRFRHENDGEALARLFDLLAPDLLRLARSMTGQWEGADDLVQSTFLAAIEHRERYRCEGRFFAWLVGILVNEIRRARGRRGRQPDPDRWRGHQKEEAPANQIVEDDELAEEIVRALESIPEPYRGVLKMRWSQDLLPEEIAGRLGRRPGTVRAQLHRGLAMLRRCLPAGLASLVFSVLPTGAALGAVRSVVTQRGSELATGHGVGLAGGGAGTGVTAGVGISAAVDSKVVILVAVALLAIAPVAYVVMQDDGADAELIANNDAGEIDAGGARVRRDAVASLNKEDTSVTSNEVAPAAKEPARLIIPSTSRTETVALSVDEQVVAMTRVFTAELPEGVSRFDIDVWPMTVFAQEIELKDAEELHIEVAGENAKISHMSWDAVLAFVGVGASPYLHPVILSGRSRSARMRPTGAHWTSRTRLAVSRIEEKKSGNRVQSVVMRLWTKSGLVERPMARTGKHFTTKEVVPISYDVRVTYVDGQERTLHVPAKGKPMRSLLLMEREDRMRLNVKDAESGLPVAMPEILAFARHDQRWGESMALDYQGGEVFELKHHRKRIRDVQLLVRAKGYYPRLVLRLPRAKRNPMHVHAIELRRRSSQRGRLLDYRGEVMAGAQVRVMSTVLGCPLLSCLTDDHGLLNWRVQTVISGRPATRLARESGDPFSVIVHDRDGGLALINEVDSVGLLGGGDLIVSEAPRRLRIKVLDEKRRPQARATVEVQIPGPHDDRLSNLADRDRLANADGLADFGNLRASEVLVTVGRAGHFPLQKMIDLPLVDEHEEVIVWPELVRISGRVPGLDASTHRLLSLRLVKAGESTRTRDSVFVSTTANEDGAFFFKVPRGQLFDLHAFAQPMRSARKTLRVLTNKIPNVSGGDESLVVEIIGARRVAIEVTGEDGEPLDSADFRWVDDPLKTPNAWNSSQSGFAGTWSAARRKLLLPFGPANLTVVAQGKEVRRRSVTVTEDTEVLRFTLASGSRVRGEVQGPSNGVVIFRLVSFRGAEWPETWLEPARKWNAYSKTTRVEKDGRFTSPPLTPGRWEILVSNQLLQTIDLSRDVDLGVLNVANER